MKKTIGVVLFIFLLSAGLQSQQQPPKDLSWAFPVKNGDLPPEDSSPKTVPGSSKTYPQAQIDDLLNPPDWFPNEHQPAPQIVLHGHGDALACGVCHLMSGVGHPESADMAGMKAEYIRRQVADFKTGIRKEPNRMNMIAGALSDEEVRQAAEWFATLKPYQWTKVVEAAMVPKTFVGGGRMRFAQPGGGMEPLGNRIITLPQDQSRATKRDPHSGFTAYVPQGSIRKGEAFVKTGGSGKSVQCAICHGDNLLGLGNVPRLAGLHPIYIARQLYQFKDGSRNGGDAQLMKKPVSQMSDADIIAVSAYLGSLNPAGPVAAAHGAPIRVFSSNGVKAAVDALKAGSESAIGHPLAPEFSTTVAAMQKIESGEPFEVAILTSEAIDALIKEGKIAANSRADIGSIGIGVGVRSGAKKPDIQTVDTLKQTLLNAKSVTYAQDGASRQTIEKMFEALSITDKMKPKLVLVNGSDASFAAVENGQAEMVITLISEILPVKGVAYVGLLPEKFQNYVHFAAGVSAGAKNSEADGGLIKFLTGPKATPTFKDKGIQAGK